MNDEQMAELIRLQVLIAKGGKAIKKVKSNNGK